MIKCESSLFFIIIAMTTLIKFPSLTFKKIETPINQSYEKSFSYMTTVHVKDLPNELNERRKINVRDPKLTSWVSKKIMYSLMEQPELFFFKNRGITLIAENASFDNKNNIVSIEMVDETKHWLLDWWHTFAVIQSYLDELPKDHSRENDAYVKVEIITGIDKIDDVVGIVEARNTSTQVKEQSLQELKNGYDAIKKILEDKPEYANRVAYKELEFDDEWEQKDIDVKEILSYLICFNIEDFDDKSHPIKAYSSKTAIVDIFKKNPDKLNKYIPLLPKILELWDTIYLNLPLIYNKQLNGKFGGLTWVLEVTWKKRRQNTELAYIKQESTYIIPKGFIYPVLAAFRNLVQLREDHVIRKEDPVKFFLQIWEVITERICERAKELKNPNKLWKDITTRRSCFDAVENQVLKRIL